MPSTFVVQYTIVYVLYVSYRYGVQEKNSLEKLLVLERQKSSTYIQANIQHITGFKNKPNTSRDNNRLGYAKVTSFLEIKLLND